MLRQKYLWLTASICAGLSLTGFSQKVVLDSTQHHVRNGEVREWSEFPVHTHETKLSIKFSAKQAEAKQLIAIRQYDVKQEWQVRLNNVLLGSLIQDEKELLLYLDIPAGTLQKENVLEITCRDPETDDIYVGPFVLYDRSTNQMLSESSVELEVEDEESKTLLPARITVVNVEGPLQPFSAPAGQLLAIRTGFAYTGNGKATLTMPAGEYIIYAGRGFEYGIDSVLISLKPGDLCQRKLSIKREVSTPGWVSSDTHIHTYTYSGHGDASVRERVLSIAGEGLELPISTDHNVLVDFKPFALDNKVNKYFTSIIGNEITTKVGHFNLFPASSQNPVTDHQVKDWQALTRALKNTPDPKVIILNHARDIHTQFRPFDPEKHLSAAGLRLDDWTFPANAMEVVNSGSQQSDLMQLTHDWFGMLNGGHFITPVGSSDSHDVSRFIVGQARTYIRANDANPGSIDVQEAVNNFLKGKVMVSSGLLTEMSVNGKYLPGDLVPAAGELTVDIHVSGPAWTKAERVVLYANGAKIREHKIIDHKQSGTKWRGAWQIPLPPHDVFLVAVAEGPGDAMPFWPIAKPFQPVSPEWRPRVIGITGAIWIDVDNNGAATSAYGYARELIQKSAGEIDKLVEGINSYDQSVALQLAALLAKSGMDLNSATIKKALRKATPETKTAFDVIRKQVKIGQQTTMR